jgi:hypothetical protein
MADAKATSDFTHELIKIVLDKGLLALVIAIAVAALNRSVEKLKSSLSWNTELLKQKLAVAGEVVAALHELNNQHEQTLGRYCMQGSANIVQDFVPALENVRANSERARLLCPPSTIEAIQQAREFAMRWMLADRRPKWLEDAGKTRNAGGNTELFVHSEEFASERRQLQGLVEAAVNRLQSEFPKALQTDH